jgi:inorganic pyrophosphatase
MWVLLISSIVLFLFGCNLNNHRNEIVSSLNYIHDIQPFTSDSLVNVVIEIPAGTNQKWEVSKQSGKIEWEKVSTDSFRVVNYLPYPANYGFVPQTLLHNKSGGDGDPVDVFILGSAIHRSTICKVRIVGIIYMVDNDEQDAKLLAVGADDELFSDVNSYEMLSNNYVGVVEIIKLWLSNYKGVNSVKVDSVGDEKNAISFLRTSHMDYNFNNK